MWVVLGWFCGFCLFGLGCVCDYCLFCCDLCWQCCCLLGFARICLLSLRVCCCCSGGWRCLRLTDAVLGLLVDVVVFGLIVLKWFILFILILFDVAGCVVWGILILVGCCCWYLLCLFGLGLICFALWWFGLYCLLFVLVLVSRRVAVVGCLLLGGCLLSLLGL